MSEQRRSHTGGMRTSGGGSHAIGVGRPRAHSATVTGESSDGDGIRIVVADDHDLYRRGMGVVIGMEDDLDIVGEARDGREAVRVAVEKAPDVVLMDVRMPRSDGIGACREIKRRVPSAKVLMLTMSDEESDLFEAIKAGASGYLLKDAPAEEVAEAIRCVHAGQSIIPPSMAAQLIAEFSRLSSDNDTDTGPDAAGAAAAPRLTDRELEVLRLVARGQANKEIARQLFISENTVKNHVRNILEKLQLHSRVEAALYAMKRNLLDDEE
ncbi:MAG TPA: response regulator transcription factor [Dermatophilaceae bacterium]|nr:response regulator transcription factor [Dermatophilaceae bacterium]